MVAHGLGLQVGSVSIRPGRRSVARTALPQLRVSRLGRTRPGQPLNPLARCLYEDQVMILYAGSIAEAIYAGDSRANIQPTDAKNAGVFLARISLDASERQWLGEELAQRVGRFLTAPEHWRRVELLAEELFRRGRLTADEVVALAPVESWADHVEREIRLSCAEITVLPEFSRQPQKGDWIASAETAPAVPEIAS